MCGRILEGILYEFLRQNLESNAEVIEKSQKKVSELGQWRLTQLIENANKAGILKYDDKLFSQVIFDFRNYIHAPKAISSEFLPDQNTVLCCLFMLHKITSRLSSLIVH